MSRFLNEAATFLNDCGEAFWQSSSAMFLQVGALVAILLLVDAVLRRKVRAIFRYWMWALVLLKLLLPVTLSTPASLAYWVTDYQPYANVDISPSSNESQTAAVEATAMDFHGSESASPLGTPNPGETTTDEAPVQAPLRKAFANSQPIVVTPERAASSIAAKPETSVVDNPATGQKPGFEEKAGLLVRPQPLRPVAWALIVWIVGVVTLSAICVQRTRFVRRLIRNSETAPGHLVDWLEQCRVELNSPAQAVKLLISDDLGSPAICGFWKPTILLPRHLVSTLDREQFRLVFAHELVHWQRCDLQVNCLQTLLQVIHFYNPFVWLANAMLRRLREQAVDEAVLVALAGESKRYSSTLLDIAAMMRRPADLAVQLIGVVESRHHLAQRIRRIVERPIPKSARLGLAGFAAIAIAAVLLLPMSGGDRSVAADDNAPKANSEKKAEAADKPTENPAEKSTDESPKKSSPRTQFTPVLSGKVVDNTGRPVTDAQLELSPKGGGRVLPTRTNEDGEYSFAKIDKGGVHYLRVHSTQGVSLERTDECPTVELFADRPTVKDVTLERACQVRVIAVDERGRPAKGVRVYATLLGEDHGPMLDATANAQGIGTIGLRASEQEYLIATSSPNFSFAKAVVKANDPNSIVKVTMVQPDGVTIEGKAICSDGEPPAGCRISALPDWWNFNSSPSGDEIRDDGTFTLKHIVPGNYNVMVSLPKGNGHWGSRPVLKSQDLTTLDQPLDLKCDFLSPSSLVQIGGKLKVSGGVQKGFWIEVRNENGEIREHGASFVRAGEEKFRIEALVPGTYTLKVDDPEIEPVEIKGVEAPSEGIEIEIKVTTKPVIHGVVVHKDTQKPLTKFRVRTQKIQTLRGANFVGDTKWHDIANEQGEFELEVIGPGIYVVEATAEGLEIARSEQINTDKLGASRAKVEVSAGAAVQGTVLNEEGQPVANAKVLLLTREAARGTRVQRSQAEVPDATTDAEGRFTLEHLAKGGHMLAILHPDYALANAMLQSDADGKFANVTVNLNRGATIRGTVYDPAGKPVPQATLVVQTDGLYRSLSQEIRDAQLSVVTDENGNYQIEHMPTKFSYLYRMNPWGTNGVVRRAVYPENGKTHRLDFGGGQKLIGKLLLNGAPLENGRLMLCDEGIGYGIFTANAETSADGSFEFLGVVPGEYTLYHAVPGRSNNWVKIKTVQLTSADTDLGTIEHVVGKVNVRLNNAAGELPADFRLTMSEHDPIWITPLDVGTVVPPEEPGDPYVIENVPPGQYQIVAHLPLNRLVIQRVDITAEKPEVDITMDLPQGTASVRGKLDLSLDPKRSFHPKLRSVDGRIQQYVRWGDAGEYAIENLPAGEYFWTEQDVRDADRLVTFTLADGEAKTLGLAPNMNTTPSAEKGFRFVNVVTPDGVPLPGCDIQLVGPGGKLSPHSSQYGRQSFVAAAGTYDMTISYPGFESYRGKLELYVKNAKGKYPDDLSLPLKLQPASK